MQWKASTGELEGLQSLKINSLYFKFQPAITGQPQYDMFAFLLTLDAANDTRMALLLFVYLFQQKISFTFHFRPSIQWFRLPSSLSENLNQLWCFWQIKRTIRKDPDGLFEFPLAQYQTQKE